MEEKAPSSRGGPRSRLGEDEDEEGEDSVEKEESLKTEVTAALVGAHEASEAPNLPLSEKTPVSQAKPKNGSQGKLKHLSIKDSVHEGTWSL
ncbi:hypothetical protein O181_070685 [Austropuccinia psidii MF-1]|uniref:Uncharacterized protein n=1 Tax=Austropuccinia psidii MF-1 TaxID=1389203 RepID=A0A9Q3EWZ4_9BASI|nr:hypothetical protein [Austropuccinia psidii MF-1]